MTTATKETLRLVLISLSTRLGILIERGLERFEVELQTHTRVDQGLKAILEIKPHVVLIEDTLRAAYNCAAAVKKRQPNTGVVLIARGMTRSKVLSAAKAGITRIVVRPFALTTLLDHVRAACEMAGNDGGQLVPTSEEVIDLLRDAPDGQAVLDQLRRVESLQAVPHVVERVLSITGDESSGATELGQVVQGDGNIAAVVLKRANSSYYSGVQKITRVRDAITRIGFSNVRNIVLALSVMNLQKTEQQQLGFDREEFWKASLATAVLAREYARHLGLPDAEEAFVIGLLSDFGCMVLDEHLPQKLEQSICLSHKERIGLSAAEKRVLGITHAQVGGFVLNRWGFPEKVIRIIGAQHAPKETGQMSVPERMLSTAVWLARWTVQGLGLGDKAELVYSYAPKSLMQGLDLESLLTDELIGQMVEEVNGMLSLFKVELRWPHEVQSHHSEIYYYEAEAPVLSPLDLIIRRLGSRPVRLDSLQALKELPPDATAIVELGGAEQLKEAAVGRNWGEQAWLFILPRGQVPKDNSIKQRAGLPVGRCGYSDYPFIVDQLTADLARLGAANLQAEDVDDA